MNVKAILKGLNLTPEQEKRLRERLAKWAPK